MQLNVKRTLLILGNNLIFPVIKYSINQLYEKVNEIYLKKIIVSKQYATNLINAIE